jgi:hypothetical protein
MEADSHGSQQAVAGASPPPRPLPHRGQFPETRPSVVERAARCGDAQALRDLCAAYWYPVYCFLRRKGCSSTQSAEVTQAMFAKLLELDDRADGRATRVARFNPDRQRFRSWLRRRAQWCFSNWQESERREPASAKFVDVHIDATSAEADWQLEVASGTGATSLGVDRLFDRCWAQIVVRRARQRLVEEYARDPREAALDVLLRRATDEPVSIELLERVRAGKTPGALDAGLSRLRTKIRARFGELLSAEIARTVPPSASVQDEIALLLDALSEG